MSTVNVMLVKNHKKEAYFTSGEKHLVDRELANALLLKCIPFAMKSSFNTKETAYSKFKEWLESPANSEVYKKGSLRSAFETYYVNFDYGFLSRRTLADTEQSSWECGDYEITPDVICSEKKRAAEVYCMQFEYQMEVENEEK